MSIWSYIWPWSRKHQDRKKIEQLYQKQLETAVDRQRSLKDATEKIREDRERRRKVRVPLQSQPILQE